MKIRISNSEKGLAVVLVVVFTCIFVILGFSMLHMAKSEIIMTQKELDSVKAFYAAEAGIAQLTTRLYNEEFDDIANTALGQANYQVELNMDADPPYAISTGTAGMEVKKIKAELSFLSSPYERAIYGGNLTESEWIFSLRGQGVPQPWGGGEVGGRDIMNGNIYVNGDAALYEESGINPSPGGNFNGDINTTGQANILDQAFVSGAVTEGVDVKSHPSLENMHYAVNNTHNVSDIFADANVVSGYLPSGHELYNVMVKNPGDRSQECSATASDDYFLEPANVTGGGDYKGATTPLNLGQDRIYYVDGDVWVHAPSTYGFLVEGKVTIVTTGDIHLSDNLIYADGDSLLSLVALGKYDDSGQLISGGNIYFGDPRYGTMYTISALMFAADSFLYNTDSVTGGAAEPESGFSVYGNLNALNQVSIEREWYDDGSGVARPARFDSSTNQWVDLETGTALSGTEINSLRHYQMIITYDDRIRSLATQTPGLPRGKGSIFAGLINWEELPGQ